MSRLHAINDSITAFGLLSNCSAKNVELQDQEIKEQEPIAVNHLQDTKTYVNFTFENEKLVHYSIMKLNSYGELVQEHITVIRKIENGYLVENKIYTQTNLDIKETYYRNYPTHIERELLGLISSFLLK